MDQFETTNGEFVETNIFVFLDARDRGDVAYLRVLRLFKVLQDGSSSDGAILQMIHAKTLQVLHVEMFQQLLARRLVCKHPVVKFEGKEPVAESLFELLLLTPFIEHFLWREIPQEFLYIVLCPFPSQEFARRDIQERYAIGRLAKMYGS